MADSTAQRRSGGALAYILTPLLLLLLTGGILVLVYSVAPVHRLQKYLNIAFMDNLKTSTKTAGLRIIEKEIRREPEEKGKDLRDRYRGISGVRRAVCRAGRTGCGH